MNAAVKSNPVLAMILANILLGSNSVIAKIGYETIPPFLFAGLRYVGAATLLYTMTYIARERINSRDYSNLAVQAFLQVTMAISWYWALTMTQAIYSSVMFLLTPIMVYVGSILFLGEPRSQKALSGSLIAFVGGVLMFGAPALSDVSGASQETMLGNGLLLFSSASLAVLILHSKKIITEKNRNTVIAVRWLVAGAVMLTISLVGENPSDILDISSRSALALAVGITFSGFIGVALFYKALEYMRAEDSSSIFYIDPLMGTILGAILLGEEFSNVALVAAGVIIVGVLVSHPVHMNRFVYYQKASHSRFEEFVHWAKSEYASITQNLKKFI